MFLSGSGAAEREMYLLKCRVIIEVKAETERSSMYLFTLQMAAMIVAGPSWNKEQGILCIFSTCLPGVEALGPLSKDVSAGAGSEMESWEQWDAGIEGNSLTHNSTTPAPITWCYVIHKPETGWAQQHSIIKKKCRSAIPKIMFKKTLRAQVT